MKLNDYLLSRRTFVASLTAAMAALCWAPGRLQAANQALIRKTIPGTGEALPVIGLGSSRTFDIGSDQAALASLVAVMQAFFANGGQVIDSSPMYGSAESVIGELLRRSGRQNKLFAATKVWTNGRENLVRSVNFVGTPLSALRNVVAVGDTPVCENAFCGAESGLIPVSTTSPAVLMSNLELQASDQRKYTQYVVPMPHEKSATRRR